MKNKKIDILMDSFNHIFNVAKENLPNDDDLAYEELFSAKSTVLTEIEKLRKKRNKKI